MYKVHVYPSLSTTMVVFHVYPYLIYHHGSIIIMVLFTMVCNYLNNVFTEHDRGVKLPSSLVLKKVFNLHIIILVM